MEPASVVVRNAGLPDVIAYVWYQLGYQPRDSLILVGVHEPEYRLGVIARADLPGPRVRRGLLAANVRALARSLTGAGADQVMALLCADEVLRLPEPALVRVLTTELPLSGLRVMEVVGVSQTGYRSLLCHDRSCCPPAGIPLDDVLETRTAATEVLFGRTLAPSEAALIADVLPLRADKFADPDDGPPEPADRRQLWRLWSAAFASGAQLPPGPARALCRSLDDARLRDSLLLLALGAPESSCEAVLDGAGASRAAGWFEPLLAEVLQRRPEVEPLHAAQRLLGPAARDVPAGQRAPVLAVLAVLAWFGGSGVRARLLTEHALADREDHPLALLVQDLLLYAVAPPWALRQPADGALPDRGRPADA